MYTQVSVTRSRLILKNRIFLRSLGRQKVKPFAINLRNFDLEIVFDNKALVFFFFLLAGFVCKLLMKGNSTVHVRSSAPAFYHEQ